MVIMPNPDFVNLTSAEDPRDFLVYPDLKDSPDSTVFPDPKVSPDKMVLPENKVLSDPPDVKDPKEKLDPKTYLALTSAFRSAMGPGQPGCAPETGHRCAHPGPEPAMPAESEVLHGHRSGVSVGNLWTRGLHPGYPRRMDVTGLQAERVAEGSRQMAAIRHHGCEVRV